MMLTSLIRRQLRIFLVISIVTVGLTSLVYARVPALLGIGVYDVHVDFRDASGLYPRALVTYRGVEVGDVSDLELTEDGARATLQVESGKKIPDDVVAELHSTSAIGEQYIDLVPAGSSTGLLEQGSLIPPERTKELPQISPVLDKLNGLLKSVPRAETRRVLNQLDEGLGGSGDDIGGVVDGAAELIDAARADIDATSSLISTLRPVLDTQIEQMGHTQAYADSLARFTTEVAARDGDLDALLTSVPGSLASARTFMKDSQQTLPALLTNLTTGARVLNSYKPNLEQIFVVYPATVARLQAAVNPRAAEGDVKLDLRANVNDPEHCTAGYLPAGQRRPPSDGSVRKVDGGAHCRLSKSSPSSVRGARNLPCPNSSARAATAAGCGLTFGQVGRNPGRTLPASGLPANDLSAVPIKQLIPTEGGDSWKALVLGPLGLS